MTFAESLSGLKYVSAIPKQIYLKEYKNNIKQFVILHKKVSKSAIYKYPKTKSLLEALYMESLKYKTFKKFKENMLSFRTSLGKKYFIKYFKYLSQLLPRYEKLIWNKTYKKIKYKKIKLEKIMKNANFNKLILKVASFYGVKEKDIELINIAFYPISYGNNINAYSIKNIETIGIFVNKRQSLGWLLGATILHEISHTIYRKSKIIQNNFLNIKNKKRNITFNEVFATAIGAGWGYNKITNKNAIKPWYNNKSYDKFAKKIYPKLKIYLDNDKMIDKEFIKYMKELL